MFLWGIFPFSWQSSIVMDEEEEGRGMEKQLEIRGNNDSILITPLLCGTSLRAYSLSLFNKHQRRIGNNKFISFIYLFAEVARSVLHLLAAFPMAKRKENGKKYMRG